MAAITRAINRKKILNIHYHSLSSGKTERDLAPFALVDNGLRWHVRAYDRVRKRFGDFVINRIEKASLQDEPIQDNESKDRDIQWNRVVELHLVPLTVPLPTHGSGQSIICG